MQVRVVETGVFAASEIDYLLVHGRRECIGGLAALIAMVHPIRLGCLIPGFPAFHLACTQLQQLSCFDDR